VTREAFNRFVGVTSSCRLPPSPYFGSTRSSVISRNLRHSFPSFDTSPTSNHRPFSSSLIVYLPDVEGGRSDSDFSRKRARAES